MRLGSYEVKLEKKVRVTGWEATTISLLAILIGLGLVGILILQAGDPDLSLELDLIAAESHGCATFCFKPAIMAPMSSILTSLTGMMPMNSPS